MLLATTTSPIKAARRRGAAESRFGRTRTDPGLGIEYGATKLAKTFNRGYIDGKMTRTITWSLITGYYDYIFPCPVRG